MRAVQRVTAPLRGLLGPDLVGARQSLTALALSSVTGTVAGVVLASITGTLDSLPGLLVLVPAAAGMRGNISGALGSRLATSIHTGTFVLSPRRDTIVGQNILAAMALTIIMSVYLGVAAKLLAMLFGVADTIGVLDLIIIATGGGVVASLVGMTMTISLAAGSTRYGWDLDNVSVPLIAAVGDMVTVPALFAATFLVGRGALTTSLGVVFVVAGLVATFSALRSRGEILRRVVRESIPVLAATGIVHSIAGVILEHRLDAFSDKPALLVLVPSALSGVGAIGGILASRLGSKLHLGIIDAGLIPDRSARRDISVALGLVVPVFLLKGILVEVAHSVFGFDSPGLAALIGISLVGGVLASSVIVVVAFYAAVSSIRFGVDPDTYGIPLVTSSADMVGSVALVLALAMWGFT